MKTAEGPWLQEFEKVRITRVKACTKDYGFVACSALNAPIGDSFGLACELIALHELLFCLGVSDSPIAPGAD
jgi:hypothetical protein